MIVADVHTTGVNWESVGTIVGSVTGVLTIVGHWINSKVDKHRKATSGQIDQIAHALTTRLDRFDTHMDEQDRELQKVSVRLARLEGPVTRAATSVESLVGRRDLDPEL